MHDHRSGAGSPSATAAPARRAATDPAGRRRRRGDRRNWDQGSRIEPPEHRPPRGLPRRRPRPVSGRGLTTGRPGRDHHLFHGSPPPGHRGQPALSRAGDRAPRPLAGGGLRPHRGAPRQDCGPSPAPRARSLFGLLRRPCRVPRRLRRARAGARPGVGPRSRHRPAARNPRRAGPGGGGAPGAAGPDPSRVAAAPRASSGATRRCGASCSSCSRIPCTTSH